MAILLQADPTRTGALRRALVADLRRRLRAIKVEVWNLVVTIDVFGLDPSPPFAANAAVQEWQFASDPAKQEKFRDWLQTMIDQKLLARDTLGKPWIEKHLSAAYDKGQARAFDDAGKRGTVSRDFFAGTKAQFLRTAAASTRHTGALAVLVTRAFNELEGISGEMSTVMSRILGRGFLQQKTATQIGQELSQYVEGLTEARAQRIARTEIVHAHAEGQLDAFEEMGLDVGILAEWVTAGDEQVCDECRPLEGRIFTVDEARGMIPVHPQCRCAWQPAALSRQRTRMKRRRRGSE